MILKLQEMVRQKNLKISSTRIKHYLDKLRQSGKIRHIGFKKAGHLEILD